MVHICPHQGCTIKGRRIRSLELLVNGQWRVDYVDGLVERFTTEPRVMHFYPSILRDQPRQ